MQSVGRINRLYGTEGEVMITLYRDFPRDFDASKPLFIKVSGLVVPLYMDSFEFRGSSSANVRFADLDSDRRVSEFISSELFLPDDDESICGDGSDEFTFEDLIGYSVEARCSDGAIFVGEISAYYDSAFNPLFGVVIDGNEVLIPAVEEFFAGIDFEGRHVVFLLPEGLLDL